jgi:molecular chaperone IbpA
MVTTSVIPTINTFPQFKHFEKALSRTIGFDSMLGRLFDESAVDRSVGGYPPWNLTRDGDTYIIEIAVAGLSDSDLNVTVDGGVLTVESKTDQATASDQREFLHQGIAKRSFKRSWTLSEDVVVQEATLVDGMLEVSLERIVPEDKKTKNIPISSSKKEQIAY